MDNQELRKALLQAFCEEAPELVQKSESALLDLEAASSTDDKQQCAESLKRAFHSLKGSASAIGRADIRAVCHTLEDLLLLGRDIAFSVDTLDRLHGGLAFLKEAILMPDSETDPAAILQYLTGGDAPKSPVEEVGALVDVEKPMQAIPEGVAVPAWEEEQVTASKPGASREKDNAAINETIRVSVAKISNIQATAGELVAIRLQQDEGLGRLLEVQKEIETLNNLWQNLKSEFYEIRHLLPRSGVTKLDQKLSVFGNKIKSSQRQVFHFATQVRSQTGQLALLSEEMDTGLRAIRMMPLGPFFESFRSVARDAARQANKKVMLESIDKGVEIDRLILEKIKEPLLHLVRNSISHGLELPNERINRGKDATGNIRLSADLNGDHVYIQIVDDGAGFDRTAILNKAIAHGLMRPGEELSNDRIMEIVSRSGFSTAQKTDMLSGRGIGMDVVTTMVSEIGGSLELETESGLGSCITLRVPSSLATTQGLIVNIGTQRFGIPLDMVERIVRSRIDALSMVEGKQVLYINDEPVSVASLATVLCQTNLEPKHARLAYPLIILKAGNRRLALLVDDIPGEIPLIIKSMGPQYELIQIYSGGAILPDGAVLPVLNVRTLIGMVADNASIRLEWSGAVDDGQATENVATVKNAPEGIIIVVDDSITTRTMERNILEAAGYKVSVATDGVEALDLLLAENNISLLVTDMEMPRMNGIELCKKVRSGRHADLPIIMVTSVSNEVEMRKGLDAGADAYIVKSDFQQDYFLELVKRLGRF